MFRSRTIVNLFLITFSFIGLKSSEQAFSQGLQITRIQINQAIAGNEANPVVEYVANKDTVLRAFLNQPALLDATKKTSAVIKLGDKEVATLNARTYDRPTDVVDFLCPSLEACGGWAAGNYLFDVTVNDVNKNTSGTTYRFEDRAEVRILAIPVKGCFRAKDGTGPGVESIVGEEWKKLDQYTRFVYPLASSKVKWVTREEFDASDCSKYNLYSDAGGSGLWQALTDMMPASCATNPKADGCYDLIVGFVSRNPKDDAGTVLAGFTMGKPTNIVCASDQDAAATVAHEVAHVYGIGDTYTGGTLRCSVNPAYSGITGKLWEGEPNLNACTATKHATADATDIPVNTFPYEVGGRGPLNTDKNGEPLIMADFMGTGGAQSIFWITPETYRHLYRQLAPPAPAALVEEQQQRLVAYSGFINPTTSAVHLEPWETYSGILDQTQNTTGDYWIQAVNASGVQLASRKLVLLPAPPAPRGQPTQDISEVPFSGGMPFPNDVAAFRIMKGTQELKVVRVSANDPIVTRVTPLAPAAVSAEYSIGWIGADPDTDALTYKVEYNFDTGNPKSEWMVLIDGLTNEDIPYIENFDELPGGTSRAQIRITATDGIRASSAVSSLFAVNAQAPYISIDDPEWGNDYEAGDEVELSADVSDIQDEILEQETQISWASDQVGALGTGATLIVDDLPPGAHRITATATNSFGVKSSTQIILNIGTLSVEYIPQSSTHDTLLTNSFTGSTSVLVPQVLSTAPALVTFTDTLRPPASSELPPGYGAWYRHFMLDYEEEKSEDWTSLKSTSGLTVTMAALPADASLAALRLFRWDRPDPARQGSWKEVTSECQPAGSYNIATARQLSIKVCALGEFALVGPAVDLNFPRMVSNSGEWMGLAVANPGSSPANLTFTAYENNGSLSATATSGKNPATRALPPGSQLAAMAFELFGSSLNTAGSWIKASSDRPGVAGFFLTFDPELNVMDGADVSTRLFNNLVFTEVQNSQISLVNPNVSQAAEITIRFINNIGIEQGTPVTASIPAGGRYSSAVSGLFPDALLSGGGYLTVASPSRGLAGTQIFAAPDVTVSTLNAADASGGSKILYSPQYVIGGGYRTALTLINLENAAANVTLAWMDDKGRPLGQTAALTLPVKGRRVISDAAIFQAALPNSGYVRASSDRRLLGTVRFGDDAGGQFDTALPFVTEGHKEVIYSQVAQNDAFYTGVAVINANVTEAKVTIAIYDTDGIFQGSGVERIAPGERISKLLPQIVPSLKAMSKGYFKVISDLPVFSFAVFGTWEFKVLAAIPPQSLDR